jgi:hypothetical protein
MTKLGRSWSSWAGLGFGLGILRTLLNPTTPVIYYGFIILLALTIFASLSMWKLHIKDDEFTNSVLLEGLRWSVVITMLLAGGVMVVGNDNLLLYGTAQGIYFGAALIFTAANVYTWLKLRK